MCVEDGQGVVEPACEQLTHAVLPCIIQVLSKSMDSSLSTDKVELATITRDEATGKVRAEQKQSYSRVGSGVRMLSAMCTGYCSVSASHHDSAANPETDVVVLVHANVRCRLTLLQHAHMLFQITFKVYEASELQPLLDAANAEKEAATETT